ncbi:hypothetical protein ABT299_22380 [Spirillospora sp. NPDC000708]
MHSETLAEALGYGGPTALAEALREHGVRPRDAKFVRGGERRRGCWLEDIHAAINT